MATSVMRTLLGIALLLFALEPAAAQDADIATNCRSIRNLRDQYRGVDLTDEQQQIKVQLVSYYRANCQRRRASRQRVDGGR